MAALIAQRLLELKAATTLADLKSLPGLRRHELKGKLDGYLAVDLVHPQRLVFKPDHNPIPQLDDGGLDWKQVTAVEVFRIGDYH
jgi:proteic killer suppression protein